MSREDLRGKISIDHATRRGVRHIDAVQVGTGSIAPSSKRDATTSSDGIATISELQHDSYVADLVRSGLDNHRGVDSAPLTKTDKSLD